MDNKNGLRYIEQAGQSHGRTGVIPESKHATSCPRADSGGGHCVDQGTFWGPKQAPASLGAMRHIRAVEMSSLSAQMPHLTKFSISLPFLA